MKIMLINPNSRERFDPHKIYTPIIAAPLGLTYLAATLIEAGHKVLLLDAYANNYSKKFLLNKIKAEDPDAVAFTLYTNDLDDMALFTREVKQINPLIAIISGGIYPTVAAEKVLEEFPSIDYILRGEAEYTIVELADALEQKKHYNGIAGISYRKEGKIIHNGNPAFIKDIDAIPLPAKHLLNRKKYYCMLSKKFPIDVMITSRGCPYHCSFCYQTSHNYRQHSPERVISEIKEIADAGIKGIEIYDENFLVDIKRNNAILSAIRKEKFDIEFRLRARVDSVNAELLQKLKKAGCSVLSYGIEFGSQKILDRTHKCITLQMSRDAMMQTKLAGIETLGFFMMGVPGETRQDILNTINFAVNLNPDFAMFTVFMPFYHTEDYEYAKKEGWIQGDYGVGKSQPWVKLPWMNDLSDILQLRQYAFKKFYFRPRFVFNFLSRNIKNQNWRQIEFGLQNVLNPLGRYNAL